MIMTTSSAMAEVIDGLRYVLNSDTKTAALLPKKDGYYSGDIIEDYVPFKYALCSFC